MAHITICHDQAHIDPMCIVGTNMWVPYEANIVNFPNLAHLDPMSSVERTCGSYMVPYRHLPGLSQH